MARRPVAAQDEFWLGLDRPENLMVVTSLLWTAEEIDPDRLRAVLRERLVDRFPVFRQRPEMHGPAGRAWWVDDPDFDLDHHLVVRRMPAPGDQRALEDFVGAQRSVPLDPGHPLWRVHLLQGYRGGSAVLLRYHHAMADGIRLIQVGLGLLDPAEGSSAGLLARVGRARPRPRLPGLAGPAFTLLHTVGSVVKIVAWTNPHTAIQGQVGVEKAVAWSEPVPFELVKGIARRTGTTVNDVCTTLVCGAVARYLEAGPAEGRLQPGDDDVAWMVPVNLEPPGTEPPPELGNHFALVLAVLPHGPAAFADRLPVVHERMGRIGESWEAVLTFALSRGLALTPGPLAGAVISFLGAKAVGVLTDVPGPREPMTLAGARVLGAVGFAPTSVQQALTATIFSYAGEVTFGFGTDTKTVPDARALVAALGEELAEAVAAQPAGAAATGADESADSVRLPHPRRTLRQPTTRQTR